MNLRSALNNGFLFLAIGATFVGLINIKGEQPPTSIDFWGFVVFFVFFRIKMWLDDAHYFRAAVTKTSNEKWLFRIGVVVAICAWSLWAMAGYSIFDLNKSYFYVLLSLGLLMTWVIIAAIARKGFEEKDMLWLLFNFIYMAVIGLIYCSKCNLSFDKNWLIGILVLGTVLDFVFSSSLDHFKEE